MEILAIAVGLTLAAYIAWCIGANDASNPTDTAVGAGALNINRALLLFSVFAFIGALLQGWMVMKTFGKGISEISSIYDAIAATSATAIWITIASYKGLPISTTHSSVGAVLGIGLFKLFMLGNAVINYKVLVTVVLSWVVSPIGAIALAAIFYVAVMNLYRKLTVSGYRVDKIFKILLIVALAYSAYSFGANDVGNATGVYVTVLKVFGGDEIQFGSTTALGLAALGAAGIMAGGFTLGKRVISTVAYGITHLDLPSGVAAELSNATIVWLFTTIPSILWGFGMPISTTHASVSAIVGVGLAKGGVSGVKWSTVFKVIISWVLTVPIAAAGSLALRTFIYYVFMV